ncbi:hypothetical protein ACWEG1_05670 [Streptomyces bauhiniae]
MKYRIDGPLRMFLSASGDGAELDVSRFLTTVFLDLFAAADDDPEGFGAELADMHSLAVSAQHQGADSHARHEFDTRMQKLLDQFADGGVIRLYQTGLRDLRDAADHISRPRPVPTQRKENAA